MTNKIIKIYSTPTCHYCNLAKDFFKQKGVKYEEFNVATDLEKRKEMVEKSGQMGVPVIDIYGDIVPTHVASAISTQRYDRLWTSFTNQGQCWASNNSTFR